METFSNWRSEPSARRPLEVSAAKLELLARGTGGGEQRQFPDREIAFLQSLDHFDADGARRTDHGHMRVAVHIKGQNIWGEGEGANVRTGEKSKG